ncbi:MAG: disulfide bond formation protein B [Acidimicrobiia bacterium]
MDVRTLNNLFGLLAVAAMAVAAVAWVGVLAVRRNQALRERLQVDLGSNLRWLAFVIATVTTIGSLYYSEVRGFLPCELCWLQRDLMYPLVVVLFVGTLRRDRGLGWYVLPFAVIGPLVSSYHLLVENVSWFKEGSTCSLSCAEPPIRVLFHFVSLAFMALSAFLAIGGLVALDAVLHRGDESRIDRRGGSVPLRAVALVAVLVPFAIGLFQTQVQNEYLADQLWYPRVAVYPLVFLIAVALARRARDLAWYSLPFVAVALILLARYFAAPPAVADPTGWWAAVAAAGAAVAGVALVLDSRAGGAASEPDASGKNGDSVRADLEVSR